MDEQQSILSFAWQLLVQGIFSPIGGILYVAGVIIAAILQSEGFGVATGPFTTKRIWASLLWPLIVVWWWAWCLVACINGAIGLLCLAFMIQYRTTKVYQTIDDLTTKMLFKSWTD